MSRRTATLLFLATLLTGIAVATWTHTPSGRHAPALDTVTDIGYDSPADDDAPVAHPLVGVIAGLVLAFALSVAGPIRSHTPYLPASRRGDRPPARGPPCG